MRLERPWTLFFVTGFVQASRIGRVGASLLGFHLARGVWLLFPFVVKWDFFFLSLLLGGNFRQILARQPQEELKLVASHSFWNQEWHLAFVFFVLFKDFFARSLLCSL